MPGPGQDSERVRVVVDTDAGLDDAHALMYLLAQDDVDLVAVTSVFGNTGAWEAARNAATVLAAANRSEVPIYLGADGPLEGEARIETFWHGVDGLGDRGLPRTEPVLQNEAAWQVLVRIANEEPGRIDLLAIGPLTNLALALRADPDLLGKFRSLVIMGGGGPYPPIGGLTFTDANSDHDRVAAQEFYTAPNSGNVVMVGVNVTLQAILDESDYEALRDRPGPWASFAAEVLDASNQTYQYTWGRLVSAAHDGLASVVLHRPSVVTRWVAAPATFTPTAGSFAVQVARTDADDPLSFETTPGPVIRAVADFDRQQFRRLFLDALSGPCPTKRELPANGSGPVEQMNTRNDS